MVELRLHGVEAAKVPAMHADVLPILERAEIHWGGRSTADYCLSCCLFQRMQLWVVGDVPEGFEEADIQAAIVTELVEYPHLRACRYVLIAGIDVDQWIAVDEVITEWARSKGCSLIEGAGRSGWKTRVQRLGYRASHLLFEKEI